MAGKKALQIALLLIMVAVVVAVVMTFDPTGGRQSVVGDPTSQEAREDLAEMQNPEGETEAKVQVTGESFEVTKSRGSLLDFLLKAKKVLAYEEGMTQLQETALELYHDEKENIQVLGPKATYDPVEDVVTLPEGFKLIYREKFVVTGGKVVFKRATGHLKSEDPIMVQDGTLSIQAESLDLDREAETVTLGQVRVTGPLGPSVQGVLTSPALVLDLSNNRGDLKGPVRLIGAAGDRLTAGSGRLVLNQERKLQAMVLSGGVHGMWSGWAWQGKQTTFQLQKGGGISSFSAVDLEWSAAGGGGHANKVKGVSRAKGWFLTLSGQVELSTSEDDNSTLKGESAELTIVDQQLVDGWVKGAPGSRAQVQGLAMADGQAELLAETVSWGPNSLSGDGRVEVIFTGLDPWHLEADRVRADRDGGSGQADGQVKWQREQQTLNANSLTWQKEGSAVRAQGAVQITFPIEGEQEPGRATGSSALMDDNRILLSGNAHVTAMEKGGLWDLKSERIEGQLKDSALVSVTGQGNVVFKRKDFFGHAQTLLYKMADQKGEMRGSPARIEDQRGARVLTSEALGFALVDDMLSVRALDGGTVSGGPLVASNVAEKKQP